MKRNEEVPDEFVSQKTSRYTTKFSDDGTMTSYSNNWSPDGIALFNELRHVVWANRKENPYFFKKLVKEWQNSHLDKEDAAIYNPMPKPGNDYTDVTPEKIVRIPRFADKSPRKKAPIEGRVLDMNDAS